MNEQVFFNRLIIAWFILAAAVFVILFFVTAPYGRHARQGWGSTVSNRIGWAVMESVSPVIFAACFLLGNYTNTITALVFLGMWEAHYIHRAFIFPLALRSSAHRMPLAVMALALVFNAANGYINGRYIFTFSGGYANEWLANPRFIIGVALFVSGFIINRHADIILRNLRKSGESGYKIPRNGLYHLISCPNYLGEIIIWTGWAVATWSLAGLTFAVWTAANLIPRARSHHIWYRERFPDYPPERRALLPKVW